MTKSEHAKLKKKVRLAVKGEITSARRNLQNLVTADLIASTGGKKTQRGALLVVGR